MSSLRHNRAGFTPYHGASPTGHGRGTGHRDFERWAPNTCAVQPRSSGTRPRHGGAGLTMVEVLIASILVASAGLMLGSGLLASNRAAQQRRLQLLTTEIAASQLALMPDAMVTGTSAAGTVNTPSGMLAWGLTATPLAGSPLAEAVLSVTGPHIAVRATTYRPVVEGP